MNKLLGALIGVIALTIIMMVGTMYFSYSNQDIRLRNLAAKEQQVTKIAFDNTWKIIQGKAQVADKYQGDFRKIYSEIMSERYSGDRAGALMSWVHEQNPNLDSSLYKEISNSIEVQRTLFAGAEERLLQIKQEDDNLIMTQPGAFFLQTLMGRKPIEVKTVTSDTTEKAFATGREDKVKVFGE